MTDTRHAAQQLRQLATDRLGFAYSAMPDARVHAALACLTTFDELAELPLKHPAWRAVIDALVIGETHFFRQAAWFSQLVTHALRPLIERGLHYGPRRLRLWSAACATGEEAYTLAIVVDQLLPDRDGWEISIVGTDLSASFIDQARHAVYRAWSLRELDPQTRERAFREIEPGHFALAPRLRDMVAFRTLNLADAVLPDEDLRDVDLIVCRNVLMYLAPEHQRAVAQRLIGRLSTAGWLAVAPAEAVAALFRPLRPVNVPSAIFFRVEPPVPRIVPPPEPPAPTRAPARRVGHRAPTTAAVVPTPADRPGAIERIRSFADHGDLQSARSQCEVLLAEDSLDYDAQLLLGLICQEQGDVAAALEASRRAIYMDPASAAAHFLCATSLRRLARAGQARREMKIVLHLLDTGASPPSRSWDITLEQLRGAATAYLAGTVSDREGTSGGVIG